MANRVTFVLAVVSLALVGAAVAVFLREGDRALAPTDSPALVVERSELDLASIAPGEHEFSVPISNRSREARRIIGLAQS